MDRPIDHSCYWHELIVNEPHMGPPAIDFADVGADRIYHVHGDHMEIVERRDNERG